MRLGKVLGAAVALSFASALSAHANVVTIGGTATVTCTPSCAAVVGGSIVDVPGPGLSGTAGSISAMTADRYEFSPANVDEEALALSVLTGASFATGIRTNVASSFDSAFSLTTSALWIALKLGSSTIFVLNDSNGPLTIDWARNGLRGAGLSHITEFGETAIPVPGAIWLMAAGLAGLGFTRRRKTAE